MTFTSPPPTWTPRADIGGKYPSLAANAQGYTQEQVERAMRAGSGVWNPRFEVYNSLGRRVLPDLENVFEARVDWDDTREIKGSLDLRMLADERLRHGFFQFLIKPWVRIQMFDGGFVEFPMGVYPWTRPKRTIHGITGKAEEWSITLGDQSHFLDVGGPGEEPLVMGAGGSAGLHLLQVLLLAGFDDQTKWHVTPTDVLLPNDLWYTYVTTAKFSWAQTGEKDAWEYKATNSGPETWLNIEKDLHVICGFAEPRFDLNGNYVAAPDRHWETEPPDVIYDTEDDSVMLVPIQTDPDMSVIANRVKGWTQPAAGLDADPFGVVNVNQFQAIVDLNYLLPRHPLAQLNTKRFIDKTLDKPTAGSYLELWWACYAELMKSLGAYEKMTVQRVGFLAQHDGPGIVGVRVTGDPELGYPMPRSPTEDSPFAELGSSVALFRETGWKCDLFTGDSESTVTSLARTIV